MVAVRYNETVSALWQDLWGASPLIPKIITFIALFIAVYIAFSLMGWLVHLSTHFVPLKGVNRMGGVMLGTGKGAVLLGLALFFTISSPMIPGQMKQKVDDSSLAPSLYRFGEGIFEAGKDKLFVLSGSSGRRGRDSRSF